MKFLHDFTKHFDYAQKALNFCGFLDELKMKKMLQIFLRLLLFTSIWLFTSCQSKAVKPSAAQEEKPGFLSVVGQTATVKVERENVRREPNGTVLGTLKKGDQITINGRLGNWLKFNSEEFEDAYIWGPSLGFPYLNFYNPYFYYDSLASDFRPVKYFQTIFSQDGTRRQETRSNYELRFNEIGFGSHEETVLEVTTTSRELVEHGITLFVNSTNNKIYMVKVDFLKPLRSVQQALLKCELPISEGAEENGGHVIWPAGKLIPKLIVDLERQEWNSKLFSSVWFKKEDGEMPTN